MGLIDSTKQFFNQLKLNHSIQGSGNVSTTTDNQLYFIRKKRNAGAGPQREGSYLNIQWVPENVNVSRNTDNQAVKVVGRNNPFYHYTSGETLLSMTLDFYSAAEDSPEVIRKCRWLESLSMNNGSEEPPENVILIWGELFKDEVWIVKNVNYQLGNFNKEFGFLPQQAYVDITLALDPDENTKVSDLI